MKDYYFKENNEQYPASGIDLSAFGIFDIEKIEDLIYELEQRKLYLEIEKEEYDREEEERRQIEEKREAKRKHREHVTSVTSMELPMDWNNVFDDSDLTENVYVESIADGYIKCLNSLGRVDIEYIASITRSDYKTVINELKGAIYQNPDKWGECFYKGWETAEEYLSGNVRKKLSTAKNANEEYNGYFQANIDALTKVVPPRVCAEDIYVTLGSPWIPAEYITQFVTDIRKKKGESYYHISRYEYIRDILFSHDTETGTWECNDPRYTDWRFDQKYGTSERSAMDIILRTLNMQSVEVKDTVYNPNTKSGKKSVVNKSATLEALEKQKKLIKEFQDWVWKDEERKRELENIYDEKFGGIKQRHYDGSFLEFPGMSPANNLFDYQKNAVARIIFSPNTLLSHDVGSGKTYIMIVAGMELKRLGMSKKNLYVVPNNIIGQWRRLFYELYPDANIICIEPKDFVPKQRQRVLREIQCGDYDAVIMPYSCFTEIEISRDCRIKVLKEEAARLDSIPGGRSSARLKKKQDKIRDEITELQGKSKVNSFWTDTGLIYELIDEDKREDTGICFDQLGITRLFIDEAHNFKNVPIETKIEKVMGISPVGSKKCKDMMDKVRIVQHDNEGAGVVFATGTPITNSITDVFIMQSYLQSGELSLLEIQNFDSWVGMFAEKNLGFEVDVDTSNFRMATRFSKFHNIPELTNILANVADFHQMDVDVGIPEHDGYEDVVIHKTTDFQRYLDKISERADLVRSGEVSRTDDNMLLITTDGRKAALDMRLVDPGCKFSTASKVFECAQKITTIYKNTTESRSTQLVFCDTSTPKDGFNIYDELKGLLVKMGIAEGEIAFIHDASTERSREKLFEAMRQGIIRVLIGSTFKLGLGVNVQTKLIALHHIDVPWRPADMVQREGRILRQGNENKKVKIYRYITEGSFDAYSWQLLETKQRFITDILSGCIDDRSGADVDDTVLDYAEVKALAIGNPLIKKRVEVANELMKYLILQKKLIDKHSVYEADLSKLKERRKLIKEQIPKVKADIASYKNGKQSYTREQRKSFQEVIYKYLKSKELIKEEQIVAFYNGFAVVIPKNTSVVHPVIYIQNTGRYMVDIKSSKNMIMKKIDDVLDGLEQQAHKLKGTLTEITGRIKFINSELKSTVDYASEIQELKVKLASIDEKLGVNNQ